MDRPDLLYPFDHVTCPWCLASPLRQPAGPTVCPVCGNDVDRSPGYQELPAPAGVPGRVADRPPWGF